jgi:amidase
MNISTAAASAGSADREIGFFTAMQAAEAIREKKISSAELTLHVFQRIERFNPALNAFAYLLKEDAMARARQADEALERGESLGVFHGVPVNVKESFAVEGHPCTWGLPPFKDSQAPRNAEVVDRLLDSGAVLVGATNVPVNLADWQSYNPIYGAANNPWDVKRTPGGSSGGSAAALAAGLGYLSVGSDIGGSIRVPSNFCGIYGHKPTLDLVSQSGHQPGGVPTAPGFSTLLAVAGPMARSAGDLLAALRVLGGPVRWDAKAWKWELPPARGESLKEFRVGYVLDDPIAPPASEVRAVLEKVIENLARAGAKMKPGWPAGFQPSALLDTYLYLLFAFEISMSPPEAQEEQRQKF